MRVGDGIEIFGESGGCDKVVDFAVLGDNIRKSIVDGVRVGNISVVGGDVRHSRFKQLAFAITVKCDQLDNSLFQAGVLLPELLNQFLGLLFSFRLCKKAVSKINESQLVHKRLERTVKIDDCKVRSRRNDRLSHDQTETTGTSGNQGDLVL